jgi:ribosomal protein S18 acetylase RimI-like enzyme
MIRPTRHSDTPRLLELTAATGVFRPHEIDTLREVLDDYHQENINLSHVSVTLEEDGVIVGFAYYAPDSMTDRSWYLYWIAVDPGLHRRGAGSTLLRHLETDIRSRSGRLLWIETSSLPSYDATRRFYLRHGYEQAAVLRDYYIDGDDMIVFRKRLDS